ncbi:hypothetical protein ACFVXC_05545 [Streptomyces sp. NPDC058257]|uniref:hypothetical protein n=1 Tax=Streptomyces sp. NPDC058257 TaxID=3346409 RepID=UPI0036EC17AA
MSSTVIPFQAEHQVANRLDGPVGREIAIVGREVENLAEAFTLRGGAIDVDVLDTLRESIDRLEMSSKLLALAEELEQWGRTIRREVGELADHRAPGALDRTARHLLFSLDQVQELIDSERPEVA